MSRPARAGTAGKPVTIRATDAERERWGRCADVAGVTVSALARTAIERSCRIIERGNSLENTGRSRRNPRR